MSSILLPWELRPVRPVPRSIGHRPDERPFFSPEAGQIIVVATLFDVNLRELYRLIHGECVPKRLELLIAEGSGICGMLATAFDVGDWPDSGETREIINNGRIQGAGGEAGDGGDASVDENGASAGNGAPGADGGLALLTRHDITMNNQGEIWGGGGGGGGGGAAATYRSFFRPQEGTAAGGGGGGGGQGTIGGDLGLGGNATKQNNEEVADDGDNGSSGSSGSAGNGGGGGDAISEIEFGETIESHGGDGGNGGAAGQSGGSGQDGNTNSSAPTNIEANGGSGGSGGNAVDGDSFVTYSSVGDIQGSQVN